LLKNREEISVTPVSTKLIIPILSIDNRPITFDVFQGSLTQSTKFSGNTKSYTPKECLMIIDPLTGKIALERLSANVRVKNVR
jgi:hypothetical protein